jgi:hypothetical protein
MKYLLIGLGTILIIAVLLSLSALMFWGLGNLIIFIFGIKYTWTFWHGLVCALVFILLKEIFGRK